MKINDIFFIDLRTKIFINFLSLVTIFFLILYGRLVCPFLEGLKFFDFFRLLFVLYLVEIGLRELVFYFFGQVKEKETPPRKAYKLSIMVWLMMGAFSVSLFYAVYGSEIPWHSQLKLLSGYWLLGAGINAQIEYNIFETVFRKKVAKQFNHSSFLDSLSQRIKESMLIFAIVPSITLMIMVVRYVFQDKIIPAPVAVEVVFIGVTLTTMAFVAASIFSKKLSLDLKSIVEGINILEKGSYPMLPVVRTDELGKVSGEMNRMIVGLKKKESIQKVFGHFISTAIADQLLDKYDEKSDLREKGEIKELTILFSDLRNFTKFSESKVPEEITSVLNNYFSNMVDVIQENGGIVNKFLGDGILAIFGLVNHNNLTASSNAVLAAKAMRKKLVDINKNLGLDLNFGVGIDSGKVVAGYIGSKDRLEFTVIGSTVNHASRIEAQTKGEGIPYVLYSTKVAQDLLKDKISSKFIKEADLKGVQGKVLLHSLQDL